MSQTNGWSVRWKANRFYGKPQRKTQRKQRNVMQGVVRCSSGGCIGAFCPVRRVSVLITVASERYEISQRVENCTKNKFRRWCDRYRALEHTAKVSVQFTVDRPIAVQSHLSNWKLCIKNMACFLLMFERSRKFEPSPSPVQRAGIETGSGA